MPEITSYHSFYIYDPNCSVMCKALPDGSYFISLNHGDLTITGDLECLLQIFAKAEALLEHEQIIKAKGVNSVSRNFTKNSPDGKQGI